MFPWGEQLLIGKESGEIKEHWLLEHIKYSFLRQRGGERRGVEAGRVSKAPGELHLFYLGKALVKSCPGICKIHCFSFLHPPRINAVSFTIYTSQSPPTPQRYSTFLTKHPDGQRKSHKSFLRSPFLKESKTQKEVSFRWDFFLF